MLLGWALPSSSTAARPGLTRRPFCTRPWQPLSDAAAAEVRPTTTTRLLAHKGAAVIALWRAPAAVFGCAETGRRNRATVLQGSKVEGIEPQRSANFYGSGAGWDATRHTPHRKGRHRAGWDALPQGLARAQPLALGLVAYLTPVGYETSKSMPQVPQTMEELPILLGPTAHPTPSPGVLSSAHGSVVLDRAFSSMMKPWSPHCGVHEFRMIQAASV